MEVGVFRGIISKKSTVTTKFSSDYSNDGTASMATTYTPLSGSPTAKVIAVAPSGSHTTTLPLGDNGMFRIYVDMSSNDEGGRITVHVDGLQHDDGGIIGDTTWVYSVQ